MPLKLILASLPAVLPPRVMAEPGIRDIPGGDGAPCIYSAAVSITRDHDHGTFVHLYDTFFPPGKMLPRSWSYPEWVARYMPVLTDGPQWEIRSTGGSPETLAVHRYSLTGG
jgi:hypothetical protein